MSWSNIIIFLEDGGILNSHYEQTDHKSGNLWNLGSFFSWQTNGLICDEPVLSKSDSLPKA